MMNKHEVIETLSLQPHPSEGGYFRRTYTSNIGADIGTNMPGRKALSSIFYMLTDDSPIGYLHKNRSDIIHYFHSGSAIRYFIIHPDGRLETMTLGNDLQAGQTLQLTVKGGCWKASELVGGEYGLISEAVSPGFEYEDMALADRNTIRDCFPACYDAVKHLIKN